MIDWSNLTLCLEGKDDAAVVLTFDEIENLVGGPLPAWRKTTQSAWADEASHAGAWRSVGRAASLDAEARTVKFEYVGPPTIHPIAPSSVAELDMAMHFDLWDLGELAVDEMGRPNLQAKELRGSGVYGFTLRGPVEADPVCYIGESENLSVRMTSYQQAATDAAAKTNRKVHRALVDCIVGGGHAELSVVLTLMVDGLPLDLGRPSARRLAENALLVHLRRQGVRCLNVDDFVLEDSD